MERRFPSARSIRSHDRNVEPIAYRRLGNRRSAEIVAKTMEIVAASSHRCSADGRECRAAQDEDRADDFVRDEAFGKKSYTEPCSVDLSLQEASTFRSRFGATYHSVCTR